MATWPLQLTAKIKEGGYPNIGRKIMLAHFSPSKSRLDS